MSDQKFVKPRLADVYRRATRGRRQPLPEVDALLALAAGERSARSEHLLADVARSGLPADLLRFARALEPESARLGLAVEQTLAGAAPSHRRDRPAPRRAAERHGLRRIAMSLAAGMVVAVAVWLVQHRHANPAAPPMAAHAPAQSDRIFAALDDRSQRAGEDRIFRGEFKRDGIFRAPFNG